MPQESQNPRGLFVTGTDTGVGKTEVSAALAALFARQGISVHPRKPVESGCSLNHQGEALFPQDGYTLQQASRTTDSLSTVTPYRFEAVLSPERAAILANQPLTLEMLQQKCALPEDAEEDALLLIEGAGGFYSPIAEQKLNAHLATALGLPVVLVAEERLGCVNQVLLTHHAIRSQGLSVAFVVLNHHQQTMETAEELMRNYDAITSRIEEPVLSISTQHINHSESTGSFNPLPNPPPAWGREALTAKTYEIINSEQPWQEISQELEAHWPLIQQAATQ